MMALMRGVVLSPLLALLWLPGAAAQTPAGRPQFEVATIRRPSPSGDRGTNMSTKGSEIRLHNATLKFCIIAAYGVQEPLIEGGPGWINSETWEILAKGDPEGDRGRPMLRSLLEDRFELKVHQEVRQRSVFVLTVSKGGHKLRGAGGGDSFLGRRGQGPITGRNASMAGLAATLSTLMGRKVLDETRLTGIYDFNLDFAPPDAVDSPLPSLVTALQEQLGLGLESTTAPVEVLVVDHAERPMLE